MLHKQWEFYSITSFIDGIIQLDADNIVGLHSETIKYYLLDCMHLIANIDS